MSSIYNLSASLAVLQNLRSTQRSLTQAQYQMSTGKKVNDARDNAASWTIATQLSADASTLRTVSAGLQTTKALVAAALTGANSVVTTITSMQTQITAAAAPGADTVAIDATLTSLLSQLQTYTANATYSGVNLLTDSSGTAHTVIGGYRRTSGSASATSNLTYYGVDLNVTAGSGVSGVAFGGGAASNAAATTLAQGASSALSVTATGVGSVYTLTIDGNNATYTQKTGDTSTNVAIGLKSAFTALGVTNATFSVSSNVITIGNANASGGASMAVSAMSFNAPAGGLSMLGGLDHSTSSATITAALAAATTAASSLGTVSSRLAAQSTFLESSATNLESAVTSITDTDMEALAAKTQALQVQAQLNTQALSMTGAQASSLLKLFGL